MTTSFLTVENDGPAIKSTNYWQTEAAKQGLFLASINAGRIRLLVPNIMRRSLLADTKQATEVIITHGVMDWSAVGIVRPPSEAYEVMWEDGSDAPYSLHLAPETFDRAPEIDPSRRFELSIYYMDPSTLRRREKVWPLYTRRTEEQMPYLKEREPQ